MLLNFSKNIFKQIGGIAYNNKKDIIAYTIISSLAVIQYDMHIQYGFWKPHIPIFPVTILGGALAIFLGFRNNSAYDRWWEARKIWGGIVNTSRTFGMYVLSYASKFNSEGNVSEEEVKAWQKKMIYRHIAWLYILINQLRVNNVKDYFESYLDAEELEEYETVNNAAVQLLNRQGKDLQLAFESGMIDTFRHMALGEIIREFYNEQGRAERIKKTVFPYYYNYFTRVFLWIFIVLLPITLVEDMIWGTVPMCIAISFVFTILEKAGAITEDPFENRAADTPMLTIARTIEIDLLQMLKEEDIPEALPVFTTSYGAKYLH